MRGKPAVTIVRIGATQKYSDNWEQIFGGKKAAKTSATNKVARIESAAKTPAPKKAAKKAAKKR